MELRRHDRAKLSGLLKLFVGAFSCTSVMPIFQHSSLFSEWQDPFSQDYESFLPNPTNEAAVQGDPPPPSPHDDGFYDFVGESPVGATETAESSQFKVPAPRKRVSLKSKVMMIRAFQGLAQTVATKANISQVKVGPHQQGMHESWLCF